MNEKNCKNSFNIEVIFDEDCMEVIELKYSLGFNELNYLAQADLLKDIVKLTDTDREKSFDKYTNSLRKIL
tara:strand:+ start:367 stop:579 length:213 start_codon:yes stop_codon:yes gene_type:complete